MTGQITNPFFNEPRSAVSNFDRSEVSLRQFGFSSTLVNVNTKSTSKLFAITLIEGAVKDKRVLLAGPPSFAADFGPDPESVAEGAQLRLLVASSLRLSPPA